MTEPLLQIEHLSKRYKNGRGVFDISFSIQKGEAFGLLGSNGAGKTTVMKMITGLLFPNSGNIHIMGKSLENNREKALYEMGALIEEPSFYSYLSAKDNLAMAAAYYPDRQLDEKWIDTLLDMVALLPYKKENVSNFSLGMKQRLGLALALVSKPSIYILDEPTNGMDIEGRVEVRKIINTLRQNSNAGFIISSHLSEEIEKTCNIVGIMKEGHLCRIERMESILSQYPSLEQFYLKEVQQNGVMAS